MKKLTNHANQSITLMAIFIKEQFKEPIALFWIMISPSALFYFFAFSKGDEAYFSTSYISAASWFYSYIASSIAFFGFSLYIIGRRESGFSRSFIYSKKARTLFLISHFFAYLFISTIYYTAFYLITKISFGEYYLDEFLDLLGRFCLCFILFCIPGLAFTLAPINFQNANTVISILSFCMLTLGAMSAAQPSLSVVAINIINPLPLANNLMLLGISDWATTTGIGIAFISAFWVTLIFFQVNPIWSRY